ncbi:rhamnogalacturonan acetylesterase [Algoriphagus machipongonensis]|uniref:Rhamnogalacturonan acetylesterase n=1 Tax=Algoriphagus machipongonensis TaxID=388413 RepID=A3HRN0_9BACT|nr:rhamnogalacturonan acetylesterase [Algoriphagus machipongonensis]EAZ82498.1 putative rhamnogalacturonan acetylesterase [Algoriphagus machipongonensis]
MKKNSSYSLNKPHYLLFFSFLFLSLFAFQEKEEGKTTLYLIGDSTVRNGGEGNLQLGWGNVLQDFFDSTKLEVSNQAMAGRSTRTFIKEGRWERVLETLKPGDFVMMQFGHNEGSEPDTTKAGYRGVLRGMGDETKELTWPDGTKETVHTYGWYLEKFITETIAKGATPIVASMIPRNKFQDGDVERADQDFGKWARAAARRHGVPFIDLNNIIGDQYDQWGPAVVKGLFERDHTHTNEAGARINAFYVTEGIRSLENVKLKDYLQKDMPTLFLIGDSTVKNGQGDGAGGLWGWGDFLAPYFDEEKIKVQNHALGGTSSRTFQTYGLWEKVLEKLEPGDYLIMQFGHNDASPLADTLRARGTIKSSGLEAEHIYNPITQKQETVYSYGQYLRQMIYEAKDKGATPIVCSLIPRNNWEDGKVNRADEDYALWAKQVAQDTNTPFIDLNKLVADEYDRLGEKYVRENLFNKSDHTHTIKDGAILNAEIVAEAIENINSIDLKSFLKN